jgi:hypothetical protein
MSRHILVRRDIAAAVLQIGCALRNGGGPCAGGCAARKPRAFEFNLQFVSRIVGAAIASHSSSTSFQNVVSNAGSEPRAWSGSEGQPMLVRMSPLPGRVRTG